LTACAAPLSIHHVPLAIIVASDESTMNFSIASEKSLIDLRELVAQMGRAAAFAAIRRVRSIVVAAAIDGIDLKCQ
jgi:hypothetical protein